MLNFKASRVAAISVVHSHTDSIKGHIRSGKQDQLGCCTAWKCERYWPLFLVLFAVDFPAVKFQGLPWMIRGEQIDCRHKTNSRAFVDNLDDDASIVVPKRRLSRPELVAMILLIGDDAGYRAHDPGADCANPCGDITRPAAASHHYYSHTNV